MSPLTKTSPSFWPIGSAMRITSSLNTIVVLIHAPSIFLKFMFIVSISFTLVMVYK